jgi:hypothetical protein
MFEKTKDKIRKKEYLLGFFQPNNIDVNDIVLQLLQKSPQQSAHWCYKQKNNT